MTRVNHDFVFMQQIITSSSPLACLPRSMTFQQKEKANSDENHLRYPLNEQNCDSILIQASDEYAR